MKCPGCGRQTDGKFCPDCGTPLKGAACRSCGASLAAGARFCNQCGAPTGAAAPAAQTARSSANTPWLLAGGVLVVIILIMVVPMFFGDDAPPQQQTTAPFASGGGTGTPPALSGDMRQNADRLFNRIMEARESGDNAAAAQFYPMAIQAYEASEPLDADGLYHLSLIQSASGNYAAARATAQRILDMSPSHLLGLGAAAEALLESGDTAAAREHYARFLEAFESERNKGYPEYLDHSAILPSYQQQARAITGG
ncbi:MAG TPA: zinc ribbon domain-containing protein [Longimicrobiales bacterium]|nr:zinc ribbon domain-containing protein [Longimicrobiales bacterium]